MGTSSSFGGPHGSSQLLPDFILDDEPIIFDAPAAGIRDANESTEDGDHLEPDVLPPRRSPNMAEARARFSDFAHHGHSRSLERSIRHYVREGLGGAKTGGQRMTRSARSGALVAQFLRTAARDGLHAALSTLRLEALEGLPFGALFAAIIDSVLPAAQTIDDDIARQALFDALIALGEAGDVNLVNLSESDIRLFFAKFICSAITHRYMADVAARGMTLAQSDFSYERLNEQVSDFIEAAVASEIARALENSDPLDERFADATITKVFEGAWQILEAVGTYADA